MFIIQENTVSFHRMKHNIPCLQTLQILCVGCSLTNSDVSSDIFNCSMSTSYVLSDE